MSDAKAHITAGDADFGPLDEEREYVHITDMGGNSLRLQQFEGKYYSPYYAPSHMKGIKPFQLRDDDVYLPTYPRSGSHWAFEQISMLLKGKAETITRIRMMHHLEVVGPDRVAQLPSPRIVATHMQLSDAPSQLTERGRVVYTIRDPKDLAVSLYFLYHDFPSLCDYKGEFKDFFYLFLEERVDCGGFFSHIRDAEKFMDKHPDVSFHVQVYEEALKNPVESVQKLSDFLGLTRNDNLCKEIGEKCEFSRLKKDKEPYTIRHDGHSPFYRKGIAGDWRNWFTDEMLEDYYRVYEDKMAGSRLYNLYARTSGT